MAHRFEFGVRNAGLQPGEEILTDEVLRRKQARLLYKAELDAQIKFNQTLAGWNYQKQVLSQRERREKLKEVRSIKIPSSPAPLLVQTSKKPREYIFTHTGTKPGGKASTASSTDDVSFSWAIWDSNRAKEKNRRLKYLGGDDLEFSGSFFGKRSGATPGSIAPHKAEKKFNPITHEPVASISGSRAENPYGRDETSIQRDKYRRGKLRLEERPLRHSVKALISPEHLRRVANRGSALIMMRKRNQQQLRAALEIRKLNRHDGGTDSLHVDDVRHVCELFFVPMHAVERALRSATRTRLGQNKNKVVIDAFLNTLLGQGVDNQRKVEDPSDKVSGVREYPSSTYSRRSPPNHYSGCKTAKDTPLTSIFHDHKAFLGADQVSKHSKHPLADVAAIFSGGEEIPKHLDYKGGHSEVRRQLRRKGPRVGKMKRWIGLNKPALRAPWDHSKAIKDTDNRIALDDGGAYLIMQRIVKSHEPLPASSPPLPLPKMSSAKYLRSAVPRSDYLLGSQSLYQPPAQSQSQQNLMEI